MFRGRDKIAVMLAIAGVVGAVSLAGIFIVYLVDTIGGDGGGEPARQTGSTGPTGVTAPPPLGGATSSGPTASLPGGTTFGGNGTPGTTDSGDAGRRNVIPDGQSFETFRNRRGGYSILYPTGWTKTGTARATTFTNARNSLQIGVGGKDSTASAFAKDISRQKNARPLGSPEVTKVGSNRAFKLSYEVRSAADEPEGLALIVDAYRLFGKERFVTMRLVTTKAAQKENADEYDRIARSFRFL